MGSVTMEGNSLTLMSMYWVRETVEGNEVVGLVSGSGRLSFTVAGLPAGARVVEAYVEADAAMGGTAAGQYTIAGRQGGRVNLPVGSGNLYKNGMPVSVQVTVRAVPSGREEGSAVIGRMYVATLSISASRLTLVYEGGSSGGGSGGGSGGEDDGPGQSGSVIAVKGPGRAGRGFTYFPEGTRDFSGNGVALQPVSAEITGEKNGDFSARLELLMEDGGAWERIGRRGIIRMPAPARQVLGAVESVSGESTFDTLVPSAQRGYIYLYSRPTSQDGAGYNLGRVPNGEKLVKLEETAGLQGGTWYKVSWEKRGLTGYCDGGQVTLSQGTQVTKNTVLQLQERDQLFRVDEVEGDEAAGLERIEARHIFYDLQKAILVGSECQMDSVPVKDALERLLSGADHPVPFVFHTDCSGTVTGDFRGQNVVEALMDPEGGILAQADASLMRDNFDVYILSGLGGDRGVRIEHGRNCEGARVNFSSLPTANRIVAVMDEKYTVHDDPNRGEGEEILTVVRKYKKEDGTAAEQAAREFENGLAGVDFEMEVDFQLLSETSRYPEYAGLQSMYLGDQMRLTLRQGKYLAEMSGYVYNSILRKYDEVTVGATSVQKSSGTVVSYQMGGVSTGKLLGQVQGSQLAAESITTDKLAAKSVTAEKLAAGALTADNIAAGSITADKLAAGAVTAEKLAAGALTADNIAAGSITTDKLAAGAVTADKIAGKTITADKMQAGLITAGSGLIGDSAIGTAQIADGSITDAKIVGLTASKITAGTLDAADVNVINLKADNITAGTLNGKVIPQLGTDKIQDGAVSGVKIVNGAVSTDKISDGAVTAAKIVSSAVTTDKLAANAVTANKILSGAVTTDKLSANAVTTDKLAAQSVTANKLASDVGSSLDLSSNNSVKLMVDDIQVGGVNLLPDTRLMASWVKSTGVRPVTANVDDEGFGVLSWPASDSITWAGAWTPSAQFIGYAAVRNKEVTVSFDFKSADWIGNENVQFHFDLWNGGTKIASKNFSIPVSASEDWHRVKAAFEITDAVFTNLSASITDATKISVYPGINRKPACALRRIKVEIGNKATDWSPAPKDGAYTASAVLDRTGIHLNTGGTFTVDSQNFGVDGSGKMTAKAGLVGGWDIAPGNLSSGSGTKHVRLSVEDATYAIWAGAEAGASAPFRVTRDGKVYLTKLYVTDENGNAQANPVNLSGSWWRTNRAVRELTVDGNTLTITLYDGTTVNFNKATVGSVAVTYAGQPGQVQVMVKDTNGGTMFSGNVADGGLFNTALKAGTPTAAIEESSGSYSITPSIVYNGTKVKDGTKVSGDSIYNAGWNKCIDSCSSAINVYTISQTAPGTLYMQVNGNYTSVGSDWVKTTRATNVYYIPGKKT